MLAVFLEDLSAAVSRHSSQPRSDQFKRIHHFLLQHTLLVSEGTHTHVPYDLFKSSIGARKWWHTPLIPTLGRQKQANLCEFKASLVYKR